MGIEVYARNVKRSYIASGCIILASHPPPASPSVTPFDPVVEGSLRPWPLPVPLSTKAGPRFRIRWPSVDLFTALFKASPSQCQPGTTTQVSLNQGSNARILSSSGSCPMSMIRR